MAEVIGSGAGFAGTHGTASAGAFSGSLTDVLKSGAASVSRSVAAGNRAKLEEIGHKVAGQAIFAATEPLPKFMRDWVQPGFVQPAPTPAWVSAIVDPLTTPIMAGAKVEALAVARRVAKPLYITVIATLLTVFGLGYMFGHKRGRERPSDSTATRKR